MTSGDLDRRRSLPPRGRVRRPWRARDHGGGAPNEETRGSDGHSAHGPALLGRCARSRRDLPEIQPRYSRFERSCLTCSVGRLCAPHDLGDYLARSRRLSRTISAMIGLTGALSSGVCEAKGVGPPPVHIGNFTDHCVEFVNGAFGEARAAPHPHTSLSAPTSRSYFPHHFSAGLRVGGKRARARLRR